MSMMKPFSNSESKIIVTVVDNIPEFNDYPELSPSEGVSISFENCERIVIPKECVEDLKFKGEWNGEKGLGKNKVYQLIIDLTILRKYFKKKNEAREKIENLIFRLSRSYNDISGIELPMEDIDLSVRWYNGYNDLYNNEYQKIVQKGNKVIITWDMEWYI